MFTKRHYKAIAKMIDQSTLVGSEYIVKPQLIYTLCEFFQQDNPNFDVHKFMVACHKEEN